MAIVSSHTLNSVDGTHAGGIVVTLTRIDADGKRTTVFETATDDGGRLSQDIDSEAIGPGASFEMIFQSGAYFEQMNLPASGLKTVRDIVIRFEMPDPEARYHLPVMLAPNSYSVCWSS
ncbi:MAG: hydroxyisourate hydrolase [Boseongicola sp.]